MERLAAIYRYASHSSRKKVLSLTFETTKRCNARCDFCDHWKEPKREETVDFVAVVRHLDPIFVVFCGGEPLLRRDIVQVVRNVSAVPGWRYLVLITNGWLLTPDKGLALHEAGVHQINVSLNWPDERQNDERRIKGLFARIEKTVPALTAQGVEVNLNTMIMQENLREVPQIARLAAEWGAKMTLTLYSEYCNGNESHQFRAEHAEQLGQVTDELIALKGHLKHITNTKWYLRQCVEFARGTRFAGCPAGKKMIHVSPQGMVKPCADMPPIAHWTEFDNRAYPGPDCDVCWMACRGEVEAPVNLERIIEVAGW